MTSTLADPPAGLVDALRRAVSELGLRASDRLAAAHDASHYLLTPQAVARPSSVAEVAELFSAAQGTGTPLTFRSAGTSLSGQAVTEAVLVDVRRHFDAIEVLEDGSKVRCGPGAVLRQVNARLQRFGRRLGPDPASEIACTIGGVVANNSSGMACGIEANTYRTLDSAVLVLPSGTVVDTGAPEADALLAQREPQLHAGLAQLRQQLLGDPTAVDRISRLHSLKNTMGYGLNSFLDHATPVKILEHLVVGSEGTLAFVAEATFRTVPLKPHAATGLLIFADLADATACLPQLVDAGFSAIELMDATSLRVSQRDAASPEEIRSLKVEHHAALLVEFQEVDESTLEARLEDAAQIWPLLPLEVPAELSTDPQRRAAFWHTRKGLFAAVAGNRPEGTTALLEDIAVPVQRLGATCEALSELFETHGYTDAVIFGHAKDGNIHFMVTEEFGDGSGTDLERYASFTEDMVELVLAHGGTLKAEHGTGRIMAPFVRRQVGDQLYSVMQRLKDLIDPHHLLNPGVLLTEDPHAHLRNLKTAPVVEEEVDRCVECGYCGPVCPSRQLTTTPRERIVLRREMARAEAAGDAELAQTLRDEYEYDAIQTCAVDGMCQTACPVWINTGDLMRRLRSETRPAIEQKVWRTAAAHWDVASQAGGLALTAADKAPAALPRGGSSLVRRLAGDGAVPQWTPDLPRGGRRREVLDHDGAELVWFSSCTQTMFGPAGPQEGGGVGDSFKRLCERAGVPLRTPEQLPSLCCGTPWKSKGLTQGYLQMQGEVISAVRQATEGGRLPLVCDASSCTEGLTVMLAEEGITMVDAIAFTAERILPVLREQRRASAGAGDDASAAAPGAALPSLALHPTCSSTRLGLNPDLETLADAVAEQVHVPQSWNCCAFAGDRGMLHPELTASATAAEAAEVSEWAATAHASTNRTCEIGMTRAVGEPYRHILQLLDEVTAPR